MEAVWDRVEASWERLGTSWEAKPSWSCFGAVLEASWRRLGDVLGRLTNVLGAFCRPLGGFFVRLVLLVERLGASWRHLVRDFQTEKWLYVSLASEMLFLMDFCQIFLPTSTSRIT